MIKRAVILSTGDELTTGRVVDSNSNYLSGKLSDIGVEVAAVITVGDVPERLEWAWRTAIGLGEVVISTGGIGPTADDLTTETIARIAGVGLWRDDASVEKIRRFFTSMNRVMPENNLKQAMFPEGATVVVNPVGTAPGFRIPITIDAHTSQVIVLPGVPREMKPMMEDTVIPWIQANRGSDTIFAVRSFQTFGISESGLDEVVAGLIAPTEGRVAFRASFPQISMRVTVEGRPGEADRKADELAARLRPKISEYVYAEGDNETMEGVVGRLLTERKLTVGIAESCTGGLIGHRLTNVPGSSSYLLGDLVTYSFSAKTGILGVSEQTLERYGAVSEQCVIEMATGARARLGTNLAIATSGIAGPDGGTPSKPVGTVCIGLVADGASVSRSYQLRGARDWIKLWTSQIALDWIRRHLLGLPISESNILRR
ncbi:MAG: competence/damage-inducible protein A [Candidatus Binataceae bacterium]|nr:competence/damage-inducible protein A [Candidatus Binataceae bacterium]